GLFHVIPRSSRSASGVVEPHTLPLDAPLTVAEKDVNGEVALKAICNAIYAATGTNILQGNIMMDFSRVTLSISSQKETGRTLLTQFLQIAGPQLGDPYPLSWQLLTGVGREPAYLLNIHEAKR
ncbi:MAG TPA: hypothetical protein VL225_19970, partial [Vicinamibacterales bacterium]|nr:hypothetical protein [Vicinamibacterales bacterium]